MVVFLPIAFIKDWLCNILSHSYKSGNNAETVERLSSSSSRSSSPLRGSGTRKESEVELGCMNRKSSDLDLSNLAEEEPLVAKYDDLNVLNVKQELTTRQIAFYGFSLAPLWFITEVSNFKMIYTLCN